MIIPVILSGGSGTRLWPLSTPERPKQFLPLIGDHSLFHETLRRVGDRALYAAPIVVGSAAHEGLCLEELDNWSGARVILEPVARNTAVAIVMAAALSAASEPEAVLLVMPSDHVIGDLEAFQRAVADGEAVANQGKLVTFGIRPTGPETGYGYLEAGDPLFEGSHAFTVARFKEKPDPAAAMAMLAAGHHYWNGGIFMFRADAFLQTCESLAPEVHRAGTEALELACREGKSIVPDLSSLEACPNISVDYAIMERSASGSIAMVPLDADWSDVGSWDALAEVAEANGKNSGVGLDSLNCYVRTNGLKVALLGVEDLIVVGHGDQVVILKRGRSQDIKRLAALAAND